MTCKFLHTSNGYYLVFTIRDGKKFNPAGFRPSLTVMEWTFLSSGQIYFYFFKNSDQIQERLGLLFKNPTPPDIYKKP